ncbi:Fic/DOC family [Citrobacter koseri]|uniref:Fic/DOC family n=1 Tax=Citrobacter koseri TaxID=545 RepID=A0A2X2XHV0_CITKO|nr:Fic/DOC family [Citrobacter koseri]
MAKNTVLREFRDTDDVVIADYDGNIVHQPPAATDLQARLQMVCDFVNDTESYVHPLAKACVLHFMLVHEHPFRDGNGAYKPWAFLLVHAQIRVRRI